MTNSHPVETLHRFFANRLLPLTAAFGCVIFYTKGGPCAKSGIIGFEETKKAYELSQIMRLSVCFSWYFVIQALFALPVKRF